MATITHRNRPNHSPPSRRRSVHRRIVVPSTVASSRRVHRRSTKIHPPRVLDSSLWRWYWKLLEVTRTKNYLKLELRSTNYAFLAQEFDHNAAKQDQLLGMKSRKKCCLALHNTLSPMNPFTSCDFGAY
ncbi:uncharacterized protein G2W53_014461 [Senna tora]|uniref:Uncharacterized protein n=1 Tax=Senna tora TaxID=362788 RepID=A0A834WTK2_9FABA|nr:uncharacterized protein G2W53_014461 [Senna tora]